MRNNTKKIALFILVIIASLIVFEYLPMRTYSPEGNMIIPVTIKNQTFLAEVVSSDEKMQKGLGQRNELCQECGMLFEFSAAGKYSFWMKDMRFPLDIIWIRQKEIAHIEKNIQPDFIGTLTPSERADQVLELNAGNVDRLELKLGDTVNY